MANRASGAKRLRFKLAFPLTPDGGWEMIRNFFAWIGCLTFLVVLVLTGWLFREDIQAWLTRGEEILMAEPSAELAISAEEKFEAIAEGRVGGEVRFTEMELQSYVQYRLAERLPPGVSDPAVDLRDSTVAMTAALDFTRLQVAPDAVEMLRRMMGDSATVQTELYPTVGAPGEGRIEILSLQAGVVPVPPMFIGMVLEGVGIRAEGRTAILTIPDDVESIRVRNEEIVLVRGR